MVRRRVLIIRRFIPHAICTRVSVHGHVAQRLLRVIVRVASVHKGQLPRHLDPYAVRTKCLLVPIEALEALIVAVQRRVLLVSEGDAGGRNAVAAGFEALRACRPLLLAFELRQMGQWDDGSAWRVCESDGARIPFVAGRSGCGAKEG